MKLQRYTALIVICLFINIPTIVGQSKAEQPAAPIRLDKSALSGVGLKKVNLKDEPEKDFYQKRLLRGDDISVFVVSTQNWVNSFKKFWFDEFVFMLNGKVIIRPTNGEEYIFYSGEYFFAPKGFSGEWEISAGATLHYELSIISTHRADSSYISKNLKPSQFDKSTLSGANIKLNKKGLFEQVLREGVELTVKLKGESPREFVLSNPEKEKFIHILSGQLTLTDRNDQQHVFYTGDYLVLPNGFTGHWKSEGHGLLKYITIEKSTHK